MNSNATVVLVIFLASAFAAGQDTATTEKSALDSGQSVCAAAKTVSKRHALIYGAAGITGDGLVMADYSCALATGPHGDLPMMILIDVRSFARREDMRRFEAKRASLRLAREAAWSVRLRGNLQCQERFRIRFNEQGEFVEANGFGYQGLAKCRIKSAYVLQLEEIERGSMDGH